ncbi:T9SS type A sorting domain-containing protein [Flavobacterium sp. CS20]|uniref:T9SS type A sorting domain-containing protein n=1 Tax=Flavobacterium sp. CS20 TaxID=2775246 RepID=UPI001B3A558E|nr:T9SS type A sorting domain-containing protein [Flavobacterium sp. CS20]QTY26334.1 T9SS type A sorting domain-containing protein [Flavobacterium sp. CS20]
MSVNTAVAKEYKLEVIADSDGHKDYKTIVTEDIREIKSISPNPANHETTIKYLIDEGDTAVIMLTHTTNGTYFNYVLNSNADSITIDLQNLSTGQYIVNLIAGSLVLDSKNLIVN